MITDRTAAAASALDAFATLTEAALHATDLVQVAQQALEVLQHHVPDLSVAFYQRQGSRLVGLVLSDNIPTEAADVARVGFPTDLAAFADTIRRRQVTFVDAWKADEQEIPETQSYGVAALFPYFQGDDLQYVLTIGSVRLQQWDEYTRTIFTAVGRSLDLARQRLAATARQDLERQELSTFVAFTEAASQIKDVLALTRLAVSTLETLIPGSDGGFYEIQGDLIHARVFSDAVSPELAAIARAGLPLDTPSFARAFQTREAVFVDDWDADTQRIDRSEDYTTVAIFPIFREGVAVAALVAGLQRRAQFVERAQWSEIERNLIQAIGRSFSLLYDRIAVATSLEQERETLDAFASFTESVSQVRDLETLVEQAFGVITRLYPYAAVTLNMREGDLFRARAVTNVSPEYEVMMRAGVPVTVPTLVQMLATCEPVFEDAHDAEHAGSADAGDFRTAVTFPLILQGEVVGSLGVGLWDRSRTTPQERAVLTAIWRSFSLIYERIAEAQELEVQRQTAERRAQVLETFAQLISRLDMNLDRVTLIREAQALLIKLLPPGYATYYEVDGGRYRLRAQVGEVGSTDFQAVQDAGFPVGETPTLDQAWFSAAPTFINVYDQTTDIDSEVVAHLRAGALLPLRIQSEVVGLFTVGLFEVTHWDPADQAVLISVVRSLELTLEGARSTLQIAEGARSLTQSNEALRAANEELEAFTYSASHDLRTPIRHVMGFTELAQKELLDTPNEKARRYLDAVRQGATRMNELIDGMLVLSRSGRQEVKWQTVDLRALVTQACQDVSTEFAARPVRWQLGNLPQVQGDRAMLQQVVTNLLSNAVKYSSKREQSEVNVWAEEHAVGWRVSVQDNGVGFNPEYARKLFGIFQRLHTERDFKGTGVGLAIVRRIVLRHGGEVFAESSGDSGATFGFTLPKLP
ncbi:ATP-binding protein [Deinococcus sp. UYEF24]